MTSIDITCTPGDGILDLSADDIAALDRAATQAAELLPVGADWQIEVRHPTATLTARPAHHRDETRTA